MTTSDDQLSGWTKKKLQNTSQSQTCTKKRAWSLFGGVWSTTAFWILAKPLCLRSMLIKLTRCTKNCNAYSWLWSTERAQHHITNTSKVEQIGLWSFSSSSIFTWPLSNWLPRTSSCISKLFAGKMLPQPAECRKFFPRVHWISKHGFLCYSNEQIYFSLARMWL